MMAKGILPGSSLNKNTTYNCIRNVMMQCQNFAPWIVSMTCSKVFQFEVVKQNLYGSKF